MARSRNIKPGFFLNDELADLAPLTRLLASGLPCLADREGRLIDRHRKIKAQLLPYDDHDVLAALDDLERIGFIFRYEARSLNYIQIVNFHKHQNPHGKEAASVIPAPPDYENVVCEGFVPVTNSIRNRILKRDQNRCLKCTSTTNLHIDHIKPLSKGGNSNDANLQVLCASCNTEKGDKTACYRHESCMNDTSGKLDQSFHPDSLNPVTDSLNPITTSKPRRTATRFDGFWSEYPKKVERKKALAKWKSRNLDDRADEIIADVINRKANDQKWLEGYIPNPTTYINGDRWNDEIQRAVPVEGNLERTLRLGEQYLRDSEGDGEDVGRNVVAL